MKIILRDETELTVSEGCVNYFKIVTTVDNIPEIFAQLTESNLSQFKLLDDNDDLSELYADKECKSVTYSAGVATFILTDIDKTLKRIASLEETVDELVLSSMGLE